MKEVPVKDRIEYTVSLVSNFAKRYSLTTTQAFNYLDRIKSTYLVKDFSFDVEQALRAVYNSQTYQKLCDPKTGLYFQSPLYVYDYLKNEIRTGKLQ